MGAMTEIGHLLVHTIFSLVIFVFLMRMILQLSRADFYNPISQFIVKYPNPVVLPLRRYVPPVGPIDTSSLLIAFLLQAIAIVVLFLMSGVTPSLGALITWSAIGLLSTIVKIYFYAVIGSIILSWISQGNYHPAAALLMQITEPVMAPFRKLLPSMGGLDLSPILVFLFINVLEVLIRHMAISAGMPAGIALGIN